LCGEKLQRYLVDEIGSSHAMWRFNHKCRRMGTKTTLRVELLAPATVHWGVDAWQDVRDVETRDTGLGVHLADLPTERLRVGACVRFTFHWRDRSRWEGRDFSVSIA